ERIDRLLLPLLATSAAAEGVLVCAGPLLGAKHLKFTRDDVRRVMRLAVLLVSGRLQLAFDVDLRAFLEVLASDLREPPEEGDAVPLGAFLRLAGLLVLPLFGSCDADLRHGVSSRRVTHFRVSAEV